MRTARSAIRSPASDPSWRWPSRSARRRDLSGLSDLRVPVHFYGVQTATSSQTFDHPIYEARHPRVSTVRWQEAVGGLPRRRWGTDCGTRHRHEGRLRKTGGTRASSRGCRRCLHGGAVRSFRSKGGSSRRLGSRRPSVAATNPWTGLTLGSPFSIMGRQPCIGSGSGCPEGEGGRPPDEGVARAVARCGSDLPGSGWRRGRAGFRRDAGDGA